jgi:molybdopterin-guanine dinucleotide biosynthesis protein B
MVVAINIVGVGRKSGKTRLILALVRELTARNHRVATIKHIFEGTFDTAHKDTWQHLHAGANPILAVSANELVSVYAVTTPSLEQALQVVPKAVDVVLIEGFKASDYPKIIVAQRLSEVKALLEAVTHVIAISGSLASDPARPSHFHNSPLLTPQELVPLVERLVTEDAVKRLPGINCGRCGYESCSALAHAILAGNASIAACQTLADHDVVLHVDGAPVFLSAFPKNFVRNTVLGMIKTLRGVKENPTHVSLEIQLD